MRYPLSVEIRCLAMQAARQRHGAISIQAYGHALEGHYVHVNAWVFLHGKFQVCPGEHFFLDARSRLLQLRSRHGWHHRVEHIKEIYHEKGDGKGPAGKGVAAEKVSDSFVGHSASSHWTQAPCRRL